MWTGRGSKEFMFMRIYVTKNCFWLENTFFPSNRALDKTPGRFRPADFDGRGPGAGFRDPEGKTIRFKEIYISLAEVYF